MPTAKQPPAPPVMFACPACGAKCITEKARREVDIFASMQCPACSATLRLKWARRIVIGYLIAFVAFCAWLWFGVGPNNLRPFMPYLGPLIVGSIVVMVVAQRKLPLVKV